MSMESFPSLPLLDTRRVWRMLFGEEIQGLRHDKGLSIEEVCRRAGMTVQAWEAVEAGHVPETWDQLCAMGRGLGESRLEMASLVLLYAGAWEGDRSLPWEVQHIYS